jgi:hypothetical protein
MHASWFRQIYDSAWQHPGLAFAGGALVLVWTLLTRLPHWRWMVALQLVMTLDALCTGALSPIPSASKWSQVASVLFVICGDARYFFLLAQSLWGKRKAVPLALLFGLCIPVASSLLQAMCPSLLPTQRHLFITYELMFCVLAMCILQLLSRVPQHPMQRWLRMLSSFQLWQYGLWTCADLLILRGVDTGYALRMIPNTMYYVLFVPFVAWTYQKESAS